MQTFKILDVNSGISYNCINNLNRYNIIFIWLYYYFVRFYNMIPNNNRIVAIGDYQDVITFDNNSIEFIADSG